MNRFQTSWEIFKRTWSVMGERPTLLVFPILIGFSTLVIGAFFTAPILLQPTGHRYTDGAHWTAVSSRVFTSESMKSMAEDASSSPQTREERRRNVHFNNKMLAYLTFAYFVSMFFATFFNVAFCSQILSALRGGEVSIGAGLRYALERWKAILFWSLLAGLVGMIIQKLQERFEIVGRIILGIIGMAWSIATVFAIPVLVEDPLASNPLEVLKRSAGIIRKTWGESLIGYLGLQFAGLLCMVALILFGAIGAGLAFLTGSGWILAVVAVVWVFFSCAMGYLSNVASQIYQSALYLYASTGRVPSAFDSQMMASAWKLK